VAEHREMGEPLPAFNRMVMPRSACPALLLPLLAALAAPAVAAPPKRARGKAAVKPSAAAPAAAKAAAPTPPAPRVQGPTPALNASEAKPILARLLAAKTAADRNAAAAALAALEPTPIQALREFLGRVRKSTDADRRALLSGIGADVPDEQGRFRAPDRQTAGDEAKNDAFDWFARLVAMPGATPALTDALADIAAIRALADTHDPDGAAAILDFAFEVDGVTYRDECGRYLRKMAPWSLPALLRGAEKEGEGSRSRYANYQLERLDRQNPRKALADAPNDQLKVAVLEAFKDSLHREAVFVVLDTIDDGSPVVRKAAREAWIEYVSGRTPPEAPKEKLQLPGGKLAEEETPLWLTSRELADIALRRRLEALTGTKPSARAKLTDLTRQLFKFHDDKRAAALGAELDRALALAKEGKTSEAADACDRILIQVPDLARRAETAPVYLKLGDELAESGKLREASAAFGKAAAVAGEDSEIGAAALARHHEARGKAAEASGRSGAAEFARAREIEAELPAHLRSADRAGRGWMLYAGIGGFLAGAALVLLGWVLRRR
jgi:hypothetical protein